ncbi:MAG TPA: flagellar basal body P-ring formation chaperone FlgA [Pseudolabrys sp.]|nr:flagellar basal body P-ring formation chaperone FlgA [Pseudolabrys sp.]
MIRLLISAFVAFALAASANAEVASQPDPERPVLKSDATINGDIVRIGDLIEHSGIVATVPIFRAPDLGYTGTISADAVLEAVRSHALIGIDTAGIREITVTRASRAIPVKDVEDAIARTLSTRFDLGPAEDIVVNFLPDMRAMYVEPSAKGQPRVTNIDFDTRNGRFDATLEFIIGSGKRSVMRLSGRANATVQVATVTRTIERGGVLKDSDVLMERRPRAEVGRDVVTKREQATGLAARNSLQPGRPLRTADLMTPDLVQRNETVTLIYEMPGILLTLRGKAVDSGGAGDVINVVNEQSKRTVQGTIVGPGRVAINTASSRVAANIKPANAP